MPSVLVEVPGRPGRVVKLSRSTVTIGASLDTDICIENADLEPTHVQIIREGDAHAIVARLRDMTVNGRREKRRTLEDHDVVRFANVQLTFFASDADAPTLRSRAESTGKTAPGDAPNDVVAAYARIHAFSMKLLANESTDALFATILDSVLELTGADKGFLVLLDAEGRPTIRATRNVGERKLRETVDALSDSILSRVIATKKPLIVANALEDRTFNASASVVNLGIMSVMCCPLLAGGTLEGLLYVGNDRVGNLFDETTLAVMNIFSAQAALLLAQAKRLDALVDEKSRLEDRIQSLELGTIIGASESMREIFKRVRKVATTDISVLITGETGTGKELVAREIHKCSRRAAGPFVVINCGAIPENLLESELFGHVRGAFTGAIATTRGRFSAAHGGTLFLDEIGELPIALQVKLLRAIEDRVITRVGDTRAEPIDIRIVAATNRVLEQEIRAGRFREDLYYRLNVVSIELPPLRNRGEDLDLLARYFLGKAAAEQNRPVRGFTKSCLVAMRSYRWPGNVRQLENRISKAVVLSERPLLTAEDMDLRAEDLEDIVPLSEAKERFQTRYINRVLEMNGGNRTKTAKDLGVDPRTIFRHLEKLQNPIPPEDGESGLDLDPLGASASAPLGRVDHARDHDSDRHS